MTHFYVHRTMSYKNMSIADIDNEIKWELNKEPRLINNKNEIFVIKNYEKQRLFDETTKSSMHWNHIHGIAYPTYVTKSAYYWLKNNYQTQPNDVFILTFPKVCLF